MDGADRARAPRARPACAPAAPRPGCWTSIRSRPTASRMPLNQVAALSIPEPSMIIAQPFDASLMGAIEKAIRSSDLGLNPANDGKVVRIPIPALTEERRKELSRHVHKDDRGGRNHVRTVRRDANDRLKKMLKESLISEDDEKRGARRGAEDHRRTRQGHRRAAEAQGRGAAWAVATSRISNAPRLAARVRSIRACRQFLCPSCALPLFARYDLDAARAWSRDSLAGPRAEHVALSRAAAAAPGRRAGHARRRVHAPGPRQAARRDARPRSPVHQGRVAQPHQLLQGPRPVGGDHPRQGARRQHHRAADRRQRRQRRGRLLRRRRARAARCSCPGTPSSRSSTSAGCTAPR